MEYLAFKHCMNYLNECWITFDTFISNRHTLINKHIEEQLSNITHYFDFWHLKKYVTLIQYILHCCMNLFGWKFLFIFLPKFEKCLPNLAMRMNMTRSYLGYVLREPPKLNCYFYALWWWPYNIRKSSLSILLLNMIIWRILFSTSVHMGKLNIDNG